MENTNKIKRTLKFGPKLSREGCAEYALTSAQLPARKLSEASLAKVRAEVERLASSPDKRVQKFLEQMKQRYPELEGGAE